MNYPEGLPAALSAPDRTLVMGILNVTPDSFSDGGLYLDHDDAVEHGLEMVRDGADIIDVGGESTRPGAQPVDVVEESRRVVSVVRDLAAQGAHVSIDTRHAKVAAACIEAGAVMVNDVSAGRGDPAMWQCVADSTVPYVLMHNRGEGSSRDDLAVYGDVVSEVVAELDVRVASAVEAGLPIGRIVVDPGIGFAKRAEHNWSLVQEDALSRLVHSSQRSLSGALPPVVMGASRKRFLGTTRVGVPRDDDSMALRDALTVEITRRAAQVGVWCVRVHDVAPNVAAVHDVTQHLLAKASTASEGSA